MSDRPDDTLTYSAVGLAADIVLDRATGFIAGAVELSLDISDTSHIVTRPEPPKPDKDGR